MRSHNEESNKKSEVGDLFLELRRKVKESELLSSSTAELAQSLHFTGRLTVVMQNGHVLKSGYEEGYFRRKEDCNF